MQCGRKGVERVAQGGNILDYYAPPFETFGY